MDSFPTIPIINYHKISDEPDVGITSRKPADFYNDMALLKQLGYQTITFKDLAEKSSLPVRPIILTFDDGYTSVLEKAYPVMETLGFTGVVYVPTDFIGKTNDWDVQFGGRRFAHLSVEELRFLRDKGFEIGSHGCSHRSLLALPPEQAYAELELSKRRIEDLLGKPVYSISYPFGRFNEALLKSVQAVGYRYGVAGLFLRKKRVAQKFIPLALRRLNVYRLDSNQTIRSKVVKQLRSPLVYRDWLFQKGSLATVLWQKWFNSDV